VLHHVLLEVADLERSGAFYDALLAPLGWRRHFDADNTIGWGIAKPVFFISANHSPQPGFGLVSFSALGIAAVKAAWEGGVAHGGDSVSEPGLTQGHASGSYSAFVRDPDGYEVEVTVGAD
jgi:catechol 2,3-dioxygenase-like lactoylglutathione lyase family enzyme